MQRAMIYDENEKVWRTADGAYRVQKRTLER